MSSSFADRLWWSRHRLKPPMGSTTLARQSGCSQALISSIERNDSEVSKYVKQFAEVLGVDPTWLSSGTEERAPEGFDEDGARRGRQEMVSGGQRIVRLTTGERLSARYTQPAPFGAPLPPLADGEAMAKDLVNRYWDYARSAGPAHAKSLLVTLDHIADLVASTQEGEGKHQARSTD